MFELLLFAFALFSFPAFIGFITPSALIGVRWSLALSILSALLGHFVSPWIFWGWFIILSLLGLFMGYITLANGFGD